MHRLILVPSLFWLVTFTPQSTPDSAAKTGDVSVADASIKEIDAQLTTGFPASARIRPGEWELKIETRTHIHDMFGESAQAHKTTVRKSPAPEVRCISQKEAENWQAAYFVRGEENENSCRYDKFVMKGGVVDAVSWCLSDVDKLTFSVRASFAPEKFTVDTDTISDWGHRIRAEVVGKRLGECPK